MTSYCILSLSQTEIFGPNVLPSTILFVICFWKRFCHFPLIYTHKIRSGTVAISFCSSRENHFRFKQCRNVWQTFGAMTLWQHKLQKKRQSHLPTCYWIKVSFVRQTNVGYDPYNVVSKYCHNHFKIFTIIFFKHQSHYLISPRQTITNLQNRTMWHHH